METLKIVLDYNNDSIEISGGDNPPTAFEKIKRIGQFKSILEEIFNRIDWNCPDKSIELELVNEDKRSTVGEW